MIKNRKSKVAMNGYFYGLNNQPAEEAFEQFNDDCVYPYESYRTAVAGAEEERKKGNFFDDNATVQIYNFELKIKKISR